MNEEKLSILQQMVQLNSNQPRSFFKKPTNCKHKSVVCECLLILVNSNLPVCIPNPKILEKVIKF